MQRGITQILIQGFRGATRKTRFDFDPSKPLVLIFGDNGTGKTTLVDAIDVVCNETRGSLEHRSSTADKHLTAISGNASQMVIELTCRGQTWLAGVHGNRVAVSGDPARPTARVLYRSKINQLIESTPSERYEQLRAFIDVDGVEKGEVSLRAAVKSAKDQLEESRRAYSDALKTLQMLWESEGKPAARDALDWAQMKALADTTDLQRQKEAFENVLNCLWAAQTSLQAYESSMREFKEANAVLRQVQSSLETVPDLPVQDGVQLVDLLKRTLSYLTSTVSTNQCPVCCQTVVPSQLRLEIEGRLQRMSNLIRLQEQLELARWRVEVARNNAKSSYQGVRQQAGELLTAAKAPYERVVRSQRFDWSKYEVVIEHEWLDDPAGRALGCELIHRIEAIRPQFEAVRDTVSRDLNQMNSILIHLGNVLGHQQTVAELERKTDYLNRALEIVHQKRLRFTQGILDSVRDECARLYSMIHPQEPLNLAALKLDEKRRASLHPVGSFAGQDDVPPTAYFSDSHLDTLGFCLFLAIAKLSNPQETILVLDDIFTTVDMTHLNRIIDLLVEECEHFAQILITTHVRPWMESLREHPACADRAQIIELEPWSIESGTRLKA